MRSLIDACCYLATRFGAIFCWEQVIEKTRHFVKAYVIPCLLSSLVCVTLESGALLGSRRADRLKNRLRRSERLDILLMHLASRRHRKLD